MWRDSLATPRVLPEERLIELEHAEPHGLGDEALDAGAEEVIDQGGGFEVITDTANLVATRIALQEAGLDYDSSEAEFVPSLSIDVDAPTARKVFQLIDALEDLDDVQNVFANFAVPADVQAELDADE